MTEVSVGAVVDRPEVGVGLQEEEVETFGVEDEEDSIPEDVDLLALEVVHFLALEVVILRPFLRRELLPRFQPALTTPALRVSSKLSNLLRSSLILDDLYDLVMGPSESLSPYEQISLL
jgi:hypothetical protein